jgi:hypothetical protein
MGEWWKTPNHSSLRKCKLKTQHSPIYNCIHSFKIKETNKIKQAKNKTKQKQKTPNNMEH